MKRNQLKEILSRYYKTAAVNHILRGIRRPSYEKIVAMHKEHGIPFDIWGPGIREWLENDNEEEKR